MQSGISGVNIEQYRNMFVNGDFSIWNEGTTFTAIASSTYHAECWDYVKIGTMVHTIVKDTADVPTVAQAGRLFPASINVDCTTIDGSIAATDICYLRQRIEGYDFAKFAQRPWRLEFWAKHTKTGIYTVGLGNSVGDRAISLEYTINASDTWEFKSIPVPASPSAGTWDYRNGVGLMVYFNLAAGSNFQQTAGTWTASGSAISSANQVNACDNTANNFKLCGVTAKLDGSNFIYNAYDFASEYARAARFYQKSYNHDTAPGAVSDVGMMQHYDNDSVTAAQTGGNHVRFHTPMRTSPTVTMYSNTSGASAKIRDVTNAVDVTPTISGQGETGFAWRATMNAAGNNCHFTGHYVANARF